MTSEDGTPAGMPPAATVAPQAGIAPRRRGAPRWAVAIIVVVVIVALAVGGLLATGHNLFGASVGGTWRITFNLGQDAAHLNLSQSFWSVSGSISDGQGTTLPVAGSVSGSKVTFGGTYAPQGTGMAEEYSFTGVVSHSGGAMSGTFHDTLHPTSGNGKTVSGSGNWAATRL